jgi:hypothetical protein
MLKQFKISAKEEWKQENGLYECPYCCSQFKKRGIGFHIWRMHTEKGKIHDPGIGYKNNTRTGWNKGYTNVEIYGLIKANEISKVVSEKLSGRGHPQTIKTRLKISNTCSINKKSGGYRAAGGRGKKGWYTGYWCDSSWELAWVIYNLEHNIKFVRNTKKFDFFFEDKICKYLPDFILEDGTYVEIKGYKTKKDEAKISQFKYKLIVLMRKELEEVFNYVIDKYGKNFINLYELHKGS